MSGPLPSSPARGPEEGESAPEAGTWIRLVCEGRDDGRLVAEGRWHLVRAWVAIQRRLILGCTRRDRGIGWAIGSGGRYRVLQSERQPRPAEEVCTRCRRAGPAMDGINRPAHGARHAGNLNASGTMH